MITIDDWFSAFSRGLPRAERLFTEYLPHKLRLVSDPNGRFSDFVVLDPNRDLPRYAAEDAAAPGHLRISEERLDTYRRAHHAASVFGLVADRLADGQVAGADLLVVRDRLLDAWTAELTSARGSAATAKSLVAEAVQAMDDGHLAEQNCLAAISSGAVTPRVYVDFAVAKLRWFGSAAQALLLDLGEPARAAALRRTYDMFSVGLQLIDDALDAADDERARGRSFPQALGMPIGAFLGAAPSIILAAANAATSHGFYELGAWLQNFGRQIEPWGLPGEPLRNAFGAAALCEATAGVMP